MKKNKNISAVQIAEIIGITSRAVEKHLKQLKEKGVIRRVGADKGGYGEVI